MADALDLSRLEALAQKATPGPYRKHGDTYIETGNNDVIASVMQRVRPEDTAANQAYIAAVSPEVVLRLVAAARALKEADGKFKALGQCVTTGEMLDIMADGRELCMAALAAPKEDVNG